MSEKHASDAFEQLERQYFQKRKGFRTVPRSQIHRIWWRRRIEDAVYRYFRFEADRRGRQFDSRAKLFGEGIGERLKDLLPGIRDRLKSFAEGTGDHPFLILRRFLPVRLGFARDESEFRRIAGGRQDPIAFLGGRKSDHQKRMLVIDSMLAGVLHLLGTEAHPQFANSERYGEDATERWEEPTTLDAPLEDVRPIFHQSTVDRRLPSGDEAYRSDTALFVVYGTIRNIRRVPLWLLAVDDVIESLRDVVRDELHNKLGRKLDDENDVALRYNKILAALFDRGYAKEIPRFTRIIRDLCNSDPSPILGKISVKGKRPGASNERTIMGFDSSLVWMTPEEDRLQDAAPVLFLRLAMLRAYKDGKAYKVRLRRHDVLIVDNLRCMVGNFAEPPRFINWRAFRLRFWSEPHPRWLRKMHGFAHAERSGVLKAELDDQDRVEVRPGRTVPFKR